MSEHRPLWAYGVLAIGVMGVSFAAIFIKMTAAPASITAMYRLLMTALMLAPFAIPGLVRTIRSLSWRDRGLLVLSGVLLATHFIFWIQSLFATTVASATIFIALQPIFALIGAHLLLHDRVGWRAWGFALFAFLGTAVIGWHDLMRGGPAAIGDLLSVVGVLFAALYMLAGQGLRPRVPALQYNFLVYLVASVVLALYSALHGDSFTHYQASDWRVFFLLALVPTILGHTIFNTLLKYLPASVISMSIVGEPIGATILAYFIFADPITWPWLVGALIVLPSVVFFMRTVYRERRNSTVH